MTPMTAVLSEECIWCTDCALSLALCSGRGGDQAGQTAPCAIIKTYTTFEDRDLGDGCRGSPLTGGYYGFKCDSLGACTGVMQAEPVGLLGTDSHGCCCSAGQYGTGLMVNEYDWTVRDMQRYQECDFLFKPDGSNIALNCVPEICQFEIIESPHKGSLFAYNDDTTAGEEVANCTKESPCPVPVRFNADQVLLDPPFVGANGRVETNKLIFRPEAGDVGDCPQENVDCYGFAATEYWKSDKQSLFLYSPIKYQIRTLTWKYIVPDTLYGGEEVKEFQRTRTRSFVEKIEDAYQKFKRNDLWQPFAVDACPCIWERPLLEDGGPYVGMAPNTMNSFRCNGDVQSTGCWDKTPSSFTDGSAYEGREGRRRSGHVTLGRLFIIDFKRMLGFDAGTTPKNADKSRYRSRLREDLICQFDNQTLAPGKCIGMNDEVFDCSDCYTSEMVADLIAEVKAGCEPGSCFKSLDKRFQATGAAFKLVRIETGLSEPSKVDTRVIPWNDLPSVGGAGAALRFDGLDDVAAANVLQFPQDAFTVMFWIKGINSDRKNQGVMQFIAEDKGIQLQVYNSHNLEVFVLDRTSGPTGVNVNSDLEWHHVAVTWTRSGTFMANDTYQGPGWVSLYVDCIIKKDSTFPRAAEANVPGGSSLYSCRNAVNKEGWAWSGQLSEPGHRMSLSGEVSIGARAACNVSTTKYRSSYDRGVNLQNNQTYCRRKVTHSCDPAFNQTPSPLYPGIYVPEDDCKETILGYYVSGFLQDQQICEFNLSDPYGTVTHGHIQKQMAMDWGLSLDADLTSGSVVSPYTIPAVTIEQAQTFLQSQCSSGCYKDQHTLLGYLDELRVYNFTMSMREIAFRSRSGVRDGVNCDDVSVPQNGGRPSIVGCGQMIDPAYKRGLIYYWPFDDPFISYASDSMSTAGMFEPFLTLESYDYAAVRENKKGNYHSGLTHAMVLGGGRNATAPMRVPSSAPVYGARLDHMLYARGTAQLFEFKIGDVDTCVNTADPLNIISDTYYLGWQCDVLSCPDSHCRNIQVVVLNSQEGSRCDPACYGNLLQATVREECSHPGSPEICAAYPQCLGELCLETSSKMRPNEYVSRFYMFTGEQFEDENLAKSGRTGKCRCDAGVCTKDTFQMVDSASTIASLYNGWTVSLQIGGDLEYRTVLCHGDRKCDPRQGESLGGRVLTLDRPISFVPNTETRYTLFRGKYTVKWMGYYYSDALGGGGIHSDLIKYDVLDLQGVAGFALNKLQAPPNINFMRFKHTLNPDAPGNSEILNFNNPQLQGNIAIGSLDVPIPFNYDISISEDTMTLLSVDVIFDDDNHNTDFNLTVNGPHELQLAQRGDFSKAGDESGDMYQVLDLSCGMLNKNSKCVVMKDEQISFATGKSGLEEVTYCDDPTYVRSDSVVEILKRSHERFHYGIISKVCTYNENATEIYNVTGYNYTCLPPCSPTLYTYQIIAPGCIENCSSQRDDMICENTHALYPDEYACIGGQYHGQHCLDLDDIATCFSMTDPTASCESRDNQPSIRTPNLREILDKKDPSIMINAIYSGDIHFVDWIHRGVQAVWSEVCVDVAAALGFELIVRYLIKNGCPWRDTAIEFAKARGRIGIVNYLTLLKPPLGRVQFTCGCPRMGLFERTTGFRRCVPFSKDGFECYQKCSFQIGTGAQPSNDPSCQDGYSHYLAPDEVSGMEAYRIEMAMFLIDTDVNPDRIPDSASCSTGSKRALIRGPKIKFLGNTTDHGLRYWDGSYVGFSDRATICDGQALIQTGEAPVKDCFVGTWPGFRTVDVGINHYDFLNYHVADKDLRILYFPPPGKTGQTAQFNYTISRMSQHPRHMNGAPIKGSPIAARTGLVSIFIEPSNDRPDPKMQNGSYSIPEDEITVLKLHWNDVDTHRQNVQVYITEFPKHGDLYQVLESVKSLNRTGESLTRTGPYNFSAKLLDPEKCITTAPNCSTGNCDHPKENCYYINETFVIGEPIYKDDVTISQFPSRIFNTTRAILHDLPTHGASECFQTDRYGGLDMDVWAGEIFCDFPYFDNIPSTCRRCMKVASDRQAIATGAWSGTLLYDPIYTQRQDGAKPIDAPNVKERGGLCSLEEQCRLGGNTESKGSCIDWHRIAPNGQATSYGEEPWFHNATGLDAGQIQAGIGWRPWSWSEINSDQPYPCAGASAINCTRNTEYLWPGYYEPARITPIYPPQPLKDTVPKYQTFNLTQYGDPVDSESFYSICNTQDIYQFMAEYEKEVFMKGFDIHMSLPDGIFFRVLAWSSRFLTEDTYELHDIVNSTTAVVEDRTKGPKPSVICAFSKTKRMQRKRTITKCAGEEWREVWRGHSQEGRPVRDQPDSIGQGKDVDHSNLRFRFHPTNFTTKQLLVQSCGHMYKSAANADPGNPLSSLENLMLIGAHGSKPKALVSDTNEYRVAYVPHSHFVGKDSFSFAADDGQQYCQRRECLDRKDVKIGVVNISVLQSNDEPIPSWMEVTGGPGETIEFEILGIDGSPDHSKKATGWIEWGTIGMGAGQGSRGGKGPTGVVQEYGVGESDSLGSPDEESDDDLEVIIEKSPEVGSFSRVRGNLFRYTPPANGGGQPIGTIVYRMRDKLGTLSSQIGQVYINYICPSGQYVNQLLKQCSNCPRGFFKPNINGRTACDSCVAGHYAPETGLTACMKCSPGKYQPRVQSSGCLRCRIGHFTNESGSDRCVPCSPGTYAPRMNATSCLHCGTLSYAPLPGMFRCYDCPRLSWSVITDSSDVANCKCTQGTYKNSIFNHSVDQLWSEDNLGVQNGSYITPTVNIVKEGPGKWPERLQLVTSNCSMCPEGGFCHGGTLAPVVRIGYWTDWAPYGTKAASDSHFWENHVDAKFYKCDANNQREVCIGYPALDLQEQNQICKTRVNYGFCDDWPNNNWTEVADVARCKAGYSDVVCSKCIEYELQQCVPTESVTNNPDDGWFGWKSFVRKKAAASFARQPIIDCYAIGSCSPNDPKEYCDRKRDACNANADLCTWQTNRYYRSYDGSCEVCPLSVLAGFFPYLIWFGVFCGVVVCIFGLALTDLNTFPITVTFWQSAALLARYRIPWPKDAQSLLSLYSVANVNLDIVPWKCFFDAAPGYRDIWFLTNLSIGGLVTASIVRWILPFLAVPPRGKILLKQFKGAMTRRDMLKGVGSVARNQYLQQRKNRSDLARPPSATVAPSQRSRRSGSASSRPGSSGAPGIGQRPSSAFSVAHSKGSGSTLQHDILVEDVVYVNDEHPESQPLQGTSFGYPARRRNENRPASLPQELMSGPRSRASLLPSQEDGIGQLPGTLDQKSVLKPHKLGDMNLQEITEDFAHEVGPPSRVRVMGGSFGVGFFKKKETGSTSNQSEKVMLQMDDGSSKRAGSTTGRDDDLVTGPHQATMAMESSTKSNDDDHISGYSKSSSKRLSFSTGGAMSAMAKDVTRGKDSQKPSPADASSSLELSAGPQEDRNGMFSFSMLSKKKKQSSTHDKNEATKAEGDEGAQPRREPAQRQHSSKPPSSRSTNRPRSAMRPPRAPDVLVLEDIHEVQALSRPISAVSRPWSAASGINGQAPRPGSAKSVSFHNTPANSRPPTAGRVRPDSSGSTDFDTLKPQTPSRLQRENDGWREYRTNNPWQASTPRMEQRLNSARSDGSSRDVPMDLGGIAWYVRKQYFDMAWRHAVGTMTLLYICSCQKTLQALKWTWWTGRDGTPMDQVVSSIAVLDCDPSIRLFDSEHAPVFALSLMVLPVTVCGPALNFIYLWGGYKSRALDDISFSMRWGYLLDPFERKYWYWSLVIAMRKFVLVYSQTFLRNFTYLQKFCPAICILANIVLNYQIRPYRVERHNVYENIMLLCLLFILLLGLITPVDITVYHDARGRNFPGPYDQAITNGVLFIQLFAFMASLVCAYADIIDAQLRTPKLVQALYMLTLGPIQMVLQIVRNVLELFFGTIWWILGKVGIRKRKAQTPDGAPKGAPKKKKQKYINPSALNRGSGDPPTVTGDRYSDILWEKVFKQFKTKKAQKILNTFEDEYDELVRPDDGATWLRDKFAIRKRIFVIERRLQREAQYDPKSTRILRMERQLTVAIDAAMTQMKRERDAYFDQLYDSQSEYEAICCDRDVAQLKLDNQQAALTLSQDDANLAKARLDATVRRTGQPEHWKKLFLEEQAKRLALEEEVVDLQAQVQTIRLDEGDDINV